MKKRRTIKKMMALLLALTTLCSLVIPATAAERSSASSTSVSFEEADSSAVSYELPLREQEDSAVEAAYQDSDTVRVSILLEEKPTLERYSLSAISGSSTAVQSYRAGLEEQQAQVASAISKQALDGSKLDVVWNLTLAANLISANVKYGQIEDILKVSGVQDVVVEQRYEPMVLDTDEAADPNMATSGSMIGSTAAYSAGYYGTGSRIAVIDTGVDTDHQSLDADAFLYAVEEDAAAAGKTVADYDLLDAEEIAEKLTQLNAYQATPTLSADKLYVNAKIAFGYNYVDESYDITHDNDSQGSHGSHVSGIATANRYVKDGTGYTAALEKVKVQGVAPDAQLITMKVFGKNGGAYDSDYMAAIEDAIVLGADSINLSLGSSNPGNSSNSTEAYQDIMDSLTESGVVVCISSGNSSYWAENSNSGGYLYADDVSMQTDGSPGSYTNALTVASADNDGITGQYLTVGDTMIFYTDGSGDNNQSLSTLAGETLEYVLIDGYGSTRDFSYLEDEEVDLTGKVLVCSRGSINFATKATNAVAAGAAAVIIYNNQSGTFGMDLSGYDGEEPCVNISQADGAAMKAAATMNEGYYIDYYTGKLTIADGIGTMVYGSDSYDVSSFSSWGVPGSLEMKPEITAPGGSIYSLDGATKGGTSYETNSGTSMAAPQVSGMVALVAQYLRETGKTGDARVLAQSLLMSTATALVDSDTGSYWSVLQQGAGLANVGDAIASKTYITMGADATDSYADGKVKVELGADENKTGTYSFSFTMHNLTEETQYYSLSADLFTQDLFTYGGVSYMDTATTPLSSSAAFSVNGTTLTAGSIPDFNGDGAGNAADADALLAYVAGSREVIQHASEADYDADGSITSYDAYQWLKRAGLALTVPASGEVTVNVTLTLTNPAELSAYPNGAYIEGYVFAKALPTSEGTVGVSHSIPVLGYYGSWSAPSMFDKGSYTAYLSGSETRAPYVGSKTANYVAVKYAGKSGSYYFGGNPILTDETYDSARNAINSENGDKLTRVGYTLIRNAAAAQLSLVGENGWTEQISGLSSAFYYTNGSTWQYTGYTEDIRWTISGAEEGETYTLKLQAATEYDVDASGNVDWDSLGAGSTLEIPFTIDNTAPVLKAASIEALNAASGTKTLTLEVEENQYLAAALLYTADGTTCLRTIDPEQTEKGNVPALTLTTEGLEDGVYLLQLYDYALNCTTYRLFLGQGATDTAESVTVSPSTLKLLPGTTGTLTASVLPVSVQDNSVTWTSSDEAVVTVSAAGIVTAKAVGTAAITATSNLTDTVYGTCEVEVFQIDKTLNAVVWGADEDAQWASFNTTTLPSYEKLTTGSDTLKAVAATYDEDGVLYAATMETDGSGATLYTVDPSASFAATEVGSTTDCFFADLAQAPTLDCLIAVYGPYLVAVDKETGSVLDALELYSNPLVGIAYCGSFYSSFNKLWLDSYLLIDSAGNVYRQNLTVTSSGNYSYTDDGDTGFLFSTGANVNAMDYFSSAYYDGTYLYWSVYDQDIGASRIFAIDAVSERCYDVGSFATNVWPVSGLLELAVGTPETNSDLTDLLGIETSALHTAAAVSDIAQTSAVAVGGLNSAIPQSASELISDEDASTVTVMLTAQDATGTDVASKNGKLTITFDSEKLALDESKTVVYAEHKALYVNGGTVTLAYADLDGFAAGEAVAKLSFNVLNDGASVTVKHEETDDSLNGTYEETLTISEETSEHLNLTHVAKVAATCVSNGNIEYWYCADCGNYFKDEACTREITNGLEGTVIEKTTHEDTDGLTEVKAADATCTDDGYTTDHWYCPTCGKRFSFDEDEWVLTELNAEEIVLPKLGGEHLRAVRDAKEATTEEAGYTGDVYCSRCGILLEKGETIPKLTTTTLDEALNVEGGTFHFETSGEYPWSVVETEDEIYAVSTNETAGTTSGTVSTQIHLEKGQALTFLWKASGATYVDCMAFYVNGAGMAVSYVQDEGDAYSGNVDDSKLTWLTGTYAAVSSGDYLFSWTFVKGDEENDYGYDGGHACLDEVQVVDAEMVTVTFSAGDHGRFTGKSSSLAGGTFSADNKTYTLTVPSGYKLQSSDIPALAPDEGYQTLSWFKGDTNWAVVPAGKYVKEDTSYTVKFAASGTGSASVTLESHNVFPDGVGYQMLLDSTHQAAKYYSSMNLIATTDYRNLADITIPSVAMNEDGKGLVNSDIAIAQVKDGDVTISVSAGTYDWVILYPYSDGDSYLLTAYDGDYPSYMNDFVFAPGYSYHFTAYMNEDGRHDSVKLEITEGTTAADATGACTISFVAGEHGSLTGTTEYTADIGTALRPGKTPKAVPEDGYVFKGWEPTYTGGTTIKGSTTYTAIFEEAGEPATIVLEATGIREKAKAVLEEYYSAMGITGDMLDMYVEFYLQEKYSYAMLLDSDATALNDATFTIYDDNWMFQVSGDLTEEQMNAFEYVLPEGFDGTLATEAMLDGTDEGGEITIQVPAGTYDVFTISRNAERGIFASLSNVDDEAYVDAYGEYTFESGYTYHFTVDFVLTEVNYGTSKMDYPCDVLTLTVTEPEPEPDPEPEPTPDTHRDPVVLPATTPSKTVLPFTDVSENQWYYDDVIYAYENNLVSGVTKTLFDPNGTVTRGQVAAILYRLAGSPNVTGSCPFSDVASGSYYEKAITWAAARGVVSGFDAHTFGPDQAISRQQFAAILYRYASLTTGIQSTKSTLATYTDAAQVADYAKDAMLWCVGSGVISGLPGGRLAPTDTVTRAQAVAMLHRFCLLEH